MRVRILQRASKEDRLMDYIAERRVRVWWIFWMWVPIWDVHNDTDDNDPKVFASEDELISYIRKHYIKPDKFRLMREANL